MNTDRLGETTVRTVGDRTVYSTRGLPPELSHDEILAYRDMCGPGRDGYQIIFRKDWMPYDYRIPDGFYMHHARLERHDDPDASWWERMFTPEKERICIVISEDVDR